MNKKMLKAISYTLKKVTGFSYAEFLIVITLIVITALGTTASLFRFVQDQAPQSAARAIRAMLRDAEQRSIAQEDGMYWGVRFENVSGRDRYMLIKSANDNASSYTAVSVVQVGASVQFVEPAEGRNSTIIFNKITGDLSIPACPSATEKSTITVNTVSIYIYCNGKIE